eukprot:71887_1
MSLSDDICSDPSDYSDIESSSPTNGETGNLSITPCDPPINHLESYHPPTHNTTFKVLPIIKSQPLSIQNTLEKDCKQIKQQSDTDSCAKRLDLEAQNLDFLLAQTMSLHPSLRWDCDNEWCRYCGARASTSFLKSPWGPKQLCHTHHMQWIQNELDLSPFEEALDIESAINPAQCTEKDYLINVLMKCDPASDGSKRRSLRIKTQTHTIKSEDDDDDIDYDIPSSSSASISNESDDSQNDYKPSLADQSSDNTHCKRRKRIFSEYTCKDCDEVFTSPSVFEHHAAEKHDNLRPFWCTQCPKTYLKQAALDGHIRKIHQKEVNFRCEWCGKAFFERTTYNMHCKKHTGIKSEPGQTATAPPCKRIKKFKPTKFACTQCDRVFRKKYYLKRHVINMHTPNQDKPYQCKYCTYGGATKKQIVWHENIHRNERRYKCTYCEKRFNNKKDVKHHVANRHTKPFKCPICPRGFGSKHYLQLHVNAVHTKLDKHAVEDMPFKCGQCGKRFQLLSYLHAHISKGHGVVKQEQQVKKKKWHRQSDKDEEVLIAMPKKPKDKHGPKKPMNSFFLFAAEIRDGVKREFDNRNAVYKQQDIAREIGKRWSVLSEEEKSKYRQIEDRLRAQHRTEIIAYQATKEYKMYKHKLDEWKRICNERKSKRWNKTKQCIVDYRSASSSSASDRSGECTDSDSDSDESSYYD